MVGWKFWASLIGSFAFPGLGHGLTFRRTRMLIWSLGNIASLLAVVVSVWVMPMMLLIRIAAMIDTWRVLSRHEGPVNRTLAAIALVIGSVGFGYAKLTVGAFKIPSSSMYPTIVIGDHVMVDKLSLYWRPVERGEIIVFTQPCAKIPYLKRVIAVGGDTVEVRCNYVYVNGQRIANQLVVESDSYEDRDDRAGRWYTRDASRYRETHGGHTYEVFHDRDAPMRDRMRDQQQVAGAHDFPQRDRPFAPSCTQGDFFAPPPGAGNPARTQPQGSIVVTKPLAQPCELQAHFVVPPNALFVMGDNRNNANNSRYWGVFATDAVIGRAIGIWLSARPGEQDWARTFRRFGAVE